jgi:hypothetical protein
MGVEFLGFAVMAVLMVAPLLIERYVRQLPAAPACPCCRGTAHEVGLPGAVAALIPTLARTFRAECGRCGWRGRMRWRFAPDSVRRNGHG